MRTLIGIHAVAEALKAGRPLDRVHVAKGASGHRIQEILSACRTGRVPDYYLHETDRWLVLPYELNGLSVDEIYRCKTGLGPIFDELKDYL